MNKEQLKKEFYRRMACFTPEGGFWDDQESLNKQRIWNFFLPHLISSQQGKPLEMGFEELDYGDINRDEMQRLKVDELFEMKGDTTNSLECAWYYGEYGSKEGLERDKKKVLNVITKTTPSHDEIKREAYKDGIWYAVYNYVEKAWEDGYLNRSKGMDLINMRRDFIAKVEEDIETLTQSKEGGERL